MIESIHSSRNDRVSSAFDGSIETLAASLASSPLEGEPNPPSQISPRAQHFAADLVGGTRSGYRRGNIPNARTMRKRMTPWEAKLWRYLRGNYLGYKFRRQQPVGAYIVDFFNAEKRLIIELDGSQHVANARDVQRNAYLNRSGYTVLRFWNNEVDADLKGVLTVILSALESTPHQIPQEGFDSPSRGELASLAANDSIETPNVPLACSPLGVRP